VVKPAPFEYHAPDTLDEALASLAEHGDEAKVLAGGQSLVPLLSMRLARPAVLIDLGRVPGLDQVTRANGSVTIGAMVRERTAERSDVITQAVPLLSQALPLIGHIAIRNRGTIGGSVAHADPAAEIPAVVVALDAEITASSAARGNRTIPASEFFQGFWTSALDTDELLTEIRIPAAAEGTGVAFEEAARRHGDFAIVGAAASVRVVDGAITDPRIVVIGVDGIPVRGTSAEAILDGASPSNDTYREAAETLASELSPSSDLHGSSAFRKHLAGVLVNRAVERAVARAGGRHE
jgi:CO/xanthine dehydrogenase FAD-binding subunit